MAFRKRADKIFSLLPQNIPIPVKKAKKALDFSSFECNSVCSSPALSLASEDRNYLNQIYDEAQLAFSDDEIKETLENNVQTPLSRLESNRSDEMYAAGKDNTMALTSSRINVTVSCLTPPAQNNNNYFSSVPPVQNEAVFRESSRMAKVPNLIATDENNLLTDEKRNQKNERESARSEEMELRVLVERETMARGSSIQVADSFNINDSSVPRLVNYTDTESENEKTPTKEDGRRKSRKRTRNPKNWKINVRQECHEKGLAYFNRKGKFVPKKEMKPPCRPDCFFKCNATFSNEVREKIFDEYYAMSREGKKNFVLAGSVSYKTKREETKKQKKGQFFRYFLPFGTEQVRVCKVMFLNTLSTSDKFVLTTHKNKKSMLVPAPDNRFKNAKPKVSEERKNIIREHIKLIPTVESHYARMDTSKQYLPSNLNISKMYREYVKYCEDIKNVEPCKESLYREIFVSEFNIDFVKPKKDLCDKCEAYRLAVKEKRVTPEIEEAFRLHNSSKLLMREERNQDRNSKEADIVAVLFDLQNVILLPHTEIGPAFYKKKLTVYNLTAHATRVEDGKKKTKTYCCIWTEGLCGRSGNDIASAFYKILTRIVRDFDHIQRLLTWSDSCVPQNRNQIISYAAGQFLEDNYFIESLTMKYSSPGHSAIQEVDNVHSQIEKALRMTEVWSPVSLIRLLMKVNSKNPFQVIQMQKEDFKDFHRMSSVLNFREVPFFRVKQLIFYQGRRNQIFYKSQHQQSEMTGVTLCPAFESKSEEEKLKIYLPRITCCPLSSKKIVLPKGKMNDLESLFDVMPKADKAYYINTFKYHREDAGV